MNISCCATQFGAGTLWKGLSLLAEVAEEVSGEFGKAFGDWTNTAGTVLRRLQREAFHRPHDQEMAELLADLVNARGVPSDWRHPNLTAPDEPMLGMEFRAGDIAMRFLTTITEFNAPQNVTLEELRIESYFPLDDETRALCEQLLG